MPSSFAPAPNHLPPERTGRPAPLDLVAIRGMIAGARDSGLWKTDPAPERLTIDGIRVLRFTPPGISRGVVMHIHGGAFRVGCPEQVGPFAAALAARCSVTVVCPEYRLAPENPYPAGLADVWRVLKALRVSSSAPLILSGDSAGGGLAASLAAMATIDGVRIEGLIVLSGWLDLTAASDSYRLNAETDPLFSLEAAREAADLYLQGRSPQEVFASPLLRPVTGFPPAFINVGAGEVLVDDARHLAAKLDEANIPAWLQILDGMDHVAVTRGFALPGASDTFDALAKFVDLTIATPG